MNQEQLQQENTQLKAEVYDANKQITELRNAITQIAQALEITEEQISLQMILDKASSAVFAEE